LPSGAAEKEETMNKHLKFLPRIIVIGLLFFASCADDEEILPDADPRDKFVGTWTVSETINQVSVPGYTSVVILDTANTSRILISNPNNLGASLSLKAIVAGNSLSIDLQNISGIPVQGSGTYSNNSFVLNYTIDEGDGPIPVKSTYTR
jgi:hypothetical protein